MKFTRARAVAVLASAALLLAGCAAAEPEPSDEPAAGPADKISVVLSWSPQPAQGGLFAAEVAGIFDKYNLDVTLVPSGPRVPRKPLLASGEVQFGMLSADEILVSREEGLNLVALHSTVQQNPLGFISHASNPLKDFEDMEGRTVFVAPGQAWWQYVVQTYDLTVNEQAYQGLATFLTDENSVTQGFVTSEPFYAAAEGVEAEFLSLDESGWSTYMNTIATTDEFLASNPDVVERFVKASLEGWAYYIENADEVNAEILKLNENATAEAQDYDTERLLPMLQSGDAASKGFGYFDPKRWEKLGEQLKKLGLIPADADVTKGYNTDYWKAAVGS
jgi:ABC-type nitrate/sulfonate/bicarbonate transport systems, periplasmic components